jgi:hypothetical protein
VWSVQVWSVQVWSVQVWSVQVWSVQVWSVQVWSVEDLFHLAKTEPLERDLMFHRVTEAMRFLKVCTVAGQDTFPRRSMSKFHMAL